MQGRLRFEWSPRVWAAFGGRYGSGLPVELEDEIDEDDYDPRVLARVDLARGRVRPSYFLDAAVGGTLWARERRVLRVQADVTNLADRLNVINFAGVFSGTALAARRAWTVRTAWEF